ncbi:MAG: hypothetical protein R3F34_17435 [Planctomycetota bacterium]
MRVFLAALFVSSIATAPSALAQSPPNFDLTVLGPASRVHALSPSGVVVGWNYTGVFPNSIERAYVAGPTTPFTLLPMPAGYDRSTANDVDSAGRICGTVAATGSQLSFGKPALWTPQPGGGYQFQFLPLPAGLTFGTADAMNEAGDIVGGGHFGNAFLVSGVHYLPNGTATNVGPLGAKRLVGLNDRRVAVDEQVPAREIDLTTQVVTTQSIPPSPPGQVLPFLGVVVNDIKNNGRVSGWGRLQTFVPEASAYAAVFRPGVGWQLDGPAGPSNTTHDVNEGGDAVLSIGSFLRLKLDGGSTTLLDGLVRAPLGSGPWMSNTGFGAQIDEQRRVVCVMTDLSTSVASLVLLTPDVTCQTDLGIGGPGTSVLSVCGDDLSSGTSAELALVGATPSAPVYLGIALAPNPTPFLGGTAVPFPPAIVVPQATDAAGVLRIAPIVGGIGPLTMYVQALYPDASSPTFVGISNAVKVDFLP